MQVPGDKFIVDVGNQLRHKVGRCADTAHRAVAHGGVQQGVLPAEHLEVHVPRPADKLGGLGDIAAGILHAHDVFHLMGQALHQARGHGIPHPARIVVQQHGGLGDSVRNGLKVEEQLPLRGL